MIGDLAMKMARHFRVYLSEKREVAIYSAKSPWDNDRKRLTSVFVPEFAKLFSDRFYWASFRTNNGSDVPVVVDIQSGHRVLDFIPVVERSQHVLDTAYFVEIQPEELGGILSYGDIVGTQTYLCDNHWATIFFVTDNMQLGYSIRDDGKFFRVEIG